jgi:anti-sigma-K factor RskA
VAGHDQIGDQAELYLLGALTPSERRAFEAHLAVCPACAAEVRAFAPVLEGLARLAPSAAPSTSLRQRILSSLSGSGNRSVSTFRAPARAALSPTRLPFGLVAAASLTLAMALGWYAAQLRARVTTLEARLHEATLRAETSELQMADARRTAFEVQSTVAVLAAPDLARIDLAGQAAAPRASARAFWSRSRGLVFTASNLPALPAGRTYQLWVLTAQPAPISAGILRPDGNGGVTARFDTPPDLPRPIAMAVTLEPEGGVPSPTGDKYLVGLAN